MLSFCTVVCVIWASVTMYSSAVKMTELLQPERSWMPKTVRGQTIAIWYWRDMRISAGANLVMVALASFRLFLATKLLVVLGWLLLIVYVAGHLWLRHHIHFLVRQNQDFWKDKSMPRRLLK